MSEEPNITPPETAEGEAAEAEAAKAEADAEKAAAEKAAGEEGQEGSSSDGDGKEGTEGADKEAEEGSEAEGVYDDFELPEGMELNQELLDKATEVFKEAGLGKEHAQKLVGIYAGEVAAAQEAQVEAYETLMSEWVDQIKSDKDYGGDKFEESKALTGRAIRAFGDEDLIQFFEDHGAGNNPALFRFMAKVGGTVKEDQPGAGDNPTSEPEDRLSILYGNK